MVGTILGIAGGIIVGVLLTILGQWWLASRQSRPATLLCELLAMAMKTSEATSKIEGIDLLYSRVGLVIINLKNTCGRRIDTVHCSLKGYGKLLAHGLAPEPAAGFDVSVSFPPAKMPSEAIGHLEIPYLNPGMSVALSLATVAPWDPPEIRVDAPDVEVKYVVAKEFTDISDLSWVRKRGAYRVRGPEVAPKQEP